MNSMKKAPEKGAVKLYDNINDNGSTFNRENIPGDIRQAQRWAPCKGKLAKTLTGKNASSMNPEHWVTLEEAEEYCREHPGHGIAYVLKDGDGVCCIDLDHCVSEDGTPNAEARATIDQLPGAYVERSMSGTGLHILFRATKPGNACRTGEIELYSCKRYICITGDVLHPAVTLPVLQTQLDRLYSDYFRDAKQPTAFKTPKKPQNAARKAEELKKRLKGNERYETLMEGDYESLGFDSASEADMALIAILARESEYNYWASRLVFCESKLYSRPGKDWPKREEYMFNGPWAKVIADPESETDDEYDDYYKQDAYDLKSLIYNPPDPVIEIVKGILPTGVALFPSIPKMGKSLLVLQLALDVAFGNKFLGYDTPKGPDGKPRRVLYLALEDGETRLYTRATKMLAGDDLPEGRVMIRTRFPKLDEAGLAHLRDEVERLNISLVIIDTWQKARAPKRRSGTAYEQEYAELEPLNRLAAELSICILLVHHNKKSSGNGSPDVTEKANGSMALSGAVDTLWSLSRERGTGAMIMNVTGRDIECEGAIHLNRDPDTLRASKAEELHPGCSTPKQQAIWQTLNSLQLDSTPKEIAQANSGLSDEYVRQTLPRLLSSGAVTKTAYGKYRATPPMVTALKQ